MLCNWPLQFLQRCERRDYINMFKLNVEDVHTDRKHAALAIVYMKI